MVNDSLEDAKGRIRRQFLGRQGVHAVALRRSTSEIVVFVDREDDDLAELRALVEVAASPHRIVIVREPRPKAG